MLENLSAKMSPKVKRAVTIGAIVVGVAAGAVVAGVIAYKLGWFEMATETAEDVVEVAQTATA